MVLGLLAGCTYGGHYSRSGPCEGWHTDSAACERSVVNRASLAKVRIGQSLEDVRALLGEPERRSVDGNGEAWGYLTDYNGDRVTTIHFAGGVVSAITEGPATAP